MLLCVAVVIAMCLLLLVDVLNVLLAPCVVACCVLFVVSDYVM